MEQYQRLLHPLIDSACLSYDYPLNIPRSETVARLKSCEGMKEAFRLLAGNPNKDGYQYVAPWYFIQKTEEKIREDLLEALK